MGKGLKFCSLLLASTLVFGCAASKNKSASGEKTTAQNSSQSYQVIFPENDVSTNQKLVRKAHSAIGTPYVYGGTTPSGFDCSGFVKWAYNSIGVQLPRTAREQSTVGQKIKNVEDMRAGDIVAFHHPKRGYHTGIYIGDGKFIHSPRKRTRVRINSLSDSYFRSTLLSARRVNFNDTGNVVAQAESKLEEYINQRGKLRLATRNMASKETEKSVATSGKKSRKGNALAANDKKRKSGKTASNEKKDKNRTVAANDKKRGSKSPSARNAKSKNKSVAKDGKNKNAAKTKTVAQNSKSKDSRAQAKKSGKSQGKNVASNNSKNNGKSAAAKKSNGKAVSMLQQKNQKHNKRNHS